MFRTITIVGRITAQGLHVRDHGDGRVTISTGTQLLTGWPVGRLLPGGGAGPGAEDVSATLGTARA